MKIFLQITGCCILLIACKPQSREGIVKENIRAYLSKTMHDFKSYEPVQFGTIDSAFTDYSSTERAKELRKLIDGLTEETKELQNQVDRWRYTDKKEAIMYANEGYKKAMQADSLLKIQIKEMTAFELKFSGYIIRHSFRGKNMNGAIILTTEDFSLDSNLKVERASPADLTEE